MKSFLVFLGLLIIPYLVLFTLVYGIYVDCDTKVMFYVGMGLLLTGLISLIVSSFIKEKEKKE